MYGVCPITNVMALAFSVNPYRKSVRNTVSGKNLVEVRKGVLIVVYKHQFPVVMS
jgi:hypothetical protein